MADDLAYTGPSYSEQLELGFSRSTSARSGGDEHSESGILLLIYFYCESVVVHFHLGRYCLKARNFLQKFVKNVNFIRIVLFYFRIYIIINYYILNT